MKALFRQPLIYSSFVIFFLLIGVTPNLAQTRQQPIHQMGHQVMPFELSKTIHIFQMTEFGGVQYVIIRDQADQDQIMLIQHHLQMEADAFANGDYSDPAKLHGADMPGLETLQKRASDIKVSYSALPNGAEIRFETADLHLVTAIHRWFGAQLSEHGADARVE